ncbi:DNA-(apurinic or apyrimidinic site) lyase 2 [Tanacetum coccineum]
MSNPILCGCGQVARCRTSWTQRNLGRRFLGCPNYLDSLLNCNFFRWVDRPLPNRWYEDRMYENHVMAMEAQDQILQLTNQNSRTSFYNRILIVLLVGIFLVRFL